MPGVSPAFSPGGCEAGRKGSHESRGKEEAALGPCARFRVLPLFTLFFHGTSVVGKSEVTPRAKARDPPRKLMSKLEQYERAV